MDHEGSTVCHYSARVWYEGKKEFLAFSPHMRVVRQETAEETEALAKTEAHRQVDKFWEEHFPEGTPRPLVIEVVLGWMTFVPDDYEWRRR